MKLIKYIRMGAEVKAISDEWNPTFRFEHDGPSAGTNGRTAAGLAGSEQFSEKMP